MHKAPLHWLFHCRASAVKALISSPSRTDPERRQAFHSRLWRQTSPRHSNKLLLVVNVSPYDNCIRRKKKKRSEAFAWLRLPQLIQISWYCETCGRNAKRKSRQVKKVKKE